MPRKYSLMAAYTHLEVAPEDLDEENANVAAGGAVGQLIRGIENAERSGELLRPLPTGSTYEGIASHSITLLGRYVVATALLRFDTP